MNGPEEIWKQAIIDELKAFVDNQACEIVEAKEADRLVQWVFINSFKMITRCVIELV